MAKSSKKRAAPKKAVKSAKRKRPGPKKSAKAAKRKRSPAVASKAKGKRQVVKKQPQLKQQAAVAHAMFLYTDDAWSLQYFNQNDLHFKERVVFG